MRASADGVSLLLLWVAHSLSMSVSVAQAGPSPSLSPDSSKITFHTSSDLVLVDVIANKNGLPDKTLQRAISKFSITVSRFRSRPLTAVRNSQPGRSHCGSSYSATCKRTSGKGRAYLQDEAVFLKLP